MIYIVMGVSGCGKSTVGKLLAKELGTEFIEGDDYHSASNVQKMAAGKPLTDEDRAGWLEALHHKILSCLEKKQSAVMSCSALKKKYRKVLSGGDKRVSFIYLKVPETILTERLKSRPGHFMKANMLQSQLATLEEPSSGEAIIIESYETTRASVDAILRMIKTTS